MLIARCRLHVVCCMLHAACCVLHVACCMLHGVKANVACWQTEEWIQPPRKRTQSRIPCEYSQVEELIQQVREEHNLQRATDLNQPLGSATKEQVQSGGPSFRPSALPCGAQCPIARAIHPARTAAHICARTGLVQPHLHRDPAYPARCCVVTTRPAHSGGRGRPAAPAQRAQKPVSPFSCNSASKSDALRRLHQDWARPRHICCRRGCCRRALLRPVQHALRVARAERRTPCRLAPRQRWQARWPHRGALAWVRRSGKPDAAQVWQLFGRWKSVRAAQSVPGAAKTVAWTLKPG